MSRTNTISGAAALASVIFVGGCAGNQPIPAASIQQAEQRIDEAERADAQRYANREINMAREKLLQAREAQDDGDEELAARLAEHAELDAAYAIALSENESVQAAVDELRATLATLESELQRNQRDTARKNDVSTVAAAVTQYTSNNRGNFPDADALDGYLDDLSDNTDPALIEVISDANDGEAIEPEDAAIFIVEGMQCGTGDNPGNVVQDGTARQFAVITKLEAGDDAYFCQTS